MENGKLCFFFISFSRKVKKKEFAKNAKKRNIKLIIENEKCKVFLLIGQLGLIGQLI